MSAEFINGACCSCNYNSYSRTEGLQKFMAEKEPIVGIDEESFLKLGNDLNLFM
jgi:hypothetical protein